MEKTATKNRYFEARGGRKTATARARVTAKGTGAITVNDKQYKKYFPLLRQQMIVEQPLEAAGMKDSVSVSVHVRGGGVTGQVEATRNAIAKALTALDPELRPKMRTEGLLTRDARMVERKHYGKKKARKSPQWSKR